MPLIINGKKTKNKYETIARAIVDFETSETTYYEDGVHYTPKSNDYNLIIYDEIDRDIVTNIRKVIRNLELKITHIKKINLQNSDNYVVIKDEEEYKKNKRSFVETRTQNSFSFGSTNTWYITIINKELDNSYLEITDIYDTLNNYKTITSLSFYEKLLRAPFTIIYDNIGIFNENYYGIKRLNYPGIKNFTHNKNIIPYRILISSRSEPENEFNRDIFYFETMCKIIKKYNPGSIKHTKYGYKLCVKENIYLDIRNLSGSVYNHKIEFTTSYSSKLFYGSGDLKTDLKDILDINKNNPPHDGENRCFITNTPLYEDAVLIKISLETENRYILCSKLATTAIYLIGFNNPVVNYYGVCAFLNAMLNRQCAFKVGYFSLDNEEEIIETLNLTDLEKNLLLLEKNNKGCEFLEIKNNIIFTDKKNNINFVASKELTDKDIIQSLSNNTVLFTYSNV